jgi:hypothetical protein
MRSLLSDRTRNIAGMVDGNGFRKWSHEAEHGYALPVFGNCVECVVGVTICFLQYKEENAVFLNPN